MLAKSPTIAVRAPMTANETKNDSQPPQIPAGGTNANNSYEQKDDSFLIWLC